MTEDELRVAARHGFVVKAADVLPALAAKDAEIAWLKAEAARLRRDLEGFYVRGA